MYCNRFLPKSSQRSQSHDGWDRGAFRRSPHRAVLARAALRLNSSIRGGVVCIPALNIVGLPDAAVQEARERVRAATRNSGSEFPLQRITINLAPADLRKADPVYGPPSLSRCSWALDRYLTYPIRLCLSGSYRSMEASVTPTDSSLWSPLPQTRDLTPFTRPNSMASKRRWSKASKSFLPPAITNSLRIYGAIPGQPRCSTVERMSAARTTAESRTTWPGPSTSPTQSRATRAS